MAELPAVLSRSDEACMSAYADGEAEAMRVLYDRHAARLYGFFARSFAEPQRAEDLVQTTFLKLHTARARYQKGAAFMPWLFSMAVRVRIDELRRIYRSQIEAGADIDSLPAPGDAGVASRELERRVRAALMALPDSQRLVVFLHRYEGMTFAEIADVLTLEGDKPVQEGTVRVRAFRAYAALREALEDLGEGLGEAKEAAQ